MIKNKEWITIYSKTSWYVDHCAALICDSIKTFFTYKLYYPEFTFMALFCKGFIGMICLKPLIQFITFLTSHREINNSHTSLTCFENMVHISKNPYSFQKY